MRRSLVLAALVAASLGLSVAQAQAHSDPTAVEDLAGHYQGFFQSSVTGEIDTFTLDMTASHNRQLDGVMISPKLPESLPFHVTVAASGVATAVSPGGGFNFVARLMEEEGIFYFFGHTESKHTLVGGTNDIGTLAFIKSFPGDGAVQLPSMLAGSFVRDDGQTGTISVDVCSQTGSDFQGVAMFGDLPVPVPRLDRSDDAAGRHDAGVGAGARAQRLARGHAADHRHVAGGAATAHGRHGHGHVRGRQRPHGELRARPGGQAADDERGLAATSRASRAAATGRASRWRCRPSARRGPRRRGPGSPRR